MAEQPSNHYLVRDEDEAREITSQRLREEASPSGEGGGVGFWSARLDMTAASAKAAEQTVTGSSGENHEPTR